MLTALYENENLQLKKGKKKSCKSITNLQLFDHLPQLLINQRAKVMCSILQSPLESTKRRVFSSHIWKQAFSRGYTKRKYKVSGLTIVQSVVLPYCEKQQTLSFQRSLGAEYYENRQESLIYCETIQKVFDICKIAHSSRSERLKHSGGWASITAQTSKLLKVIEA